MTQRKRRAARAKGRAAATSRTIVKRRLVPKPKPARKSPGKGRRSGTQTSPRRTVRPRAIKSFTRRPRGRPARKPVLKSIRKVRGRGTRVSKPAAVPRAKSAASPRPRASSKRVSKARPRPSAPAPRRPKPSLPPAPIVKTPYPADWFLSDYETGATRRGQLAYLRRTIQQLRSVYRGFGAADGFDARYPQNWTTAQHQEVMEYGARLHSLMSGQYVIVRPRTKAEERALRVHTQQWVARQKAFVVHTSKPLIAQVHYVTQPEKQMPFGARSIGGGLRVEMVQTYQDGKLVLADRDYLFEEMLGFQPYDWRDFLYALRMLLPLLPDKTPTGKDAMYTLLSREHGPIGSPVLKHFLLQVLQEWAETYEDEFGATLIGVRYQGDRWVAAMSPASEYNKRQERRVLYRKIRAADAQEARKIKTRVGPRVKPKLKAKLARKK